MSVIELSDLRDGYVDLADWLSRHSYPVTSRGLATREVTGASIVFDRPDGVMLPIGVNRRVNARLAAVEALQLLSGTGDVELLRRASPNYTEVLVDPAAAAYGAYGPRLREQLDELVTELTAHPTSRRAVLSIWRPDDLFHDGDRPCTLTLQLLLRRDHLELIVSMRSQDLWLGVPYDVFMFSQLQLSLAARLDVGVGRYTHHVGSLHLYDRDVDAVDALARCGDARSIDDYPRGVITDGTNSFTDVAARLLDGTRTDADVTVNAWYTRQLARLGPA